MTSRGMLATIAVVSAAAFFGIKEASSPWGIEWGIVALAGAYGLAGIALQIRSLVAQVIARGAFWVALVPASLYAIETIAHGRVPDATAITTAIAAGSALLLARPLLHTERARAELAPAYCRPLFLTSAIWASILALPALTVGTFFDHGQPRFFALGALLLATAIGIVRMRGWSILTGIAAALVGMVLTWTDHYTPILLTAAPALLLIATLFHARAEARRAPRYIRVADDAEQASSAVRIANLDVALDEEEEASAPLRARHLNQ